MSIPNTPVPDELAAVRQELTRLKTREAELRALILANPDVRTGAHWLADVRTVQQERTDLKELRAAYPDAVAEHTYPTEITRIVLSGITEDGEVVSARQMRSAKETTQ